MLAESALILVAAASAIGSIASSDWRGERDVRRIASTFNVPDLQFYLIRKSAAKTVVQLNEFRMEDSFMGTGPTGGMRVSLARQALVQRAKPCLDKAFARRGYSINYPVTVYVN